MGCFETLGAVTEWLGKGGSFIVGGFSGFLVSYLARRPKLELSSGPTGGDVAYGTFLNRPTFFGLKITREAATITVAVIFDEVEDLSTQAALDWRVDGNQYVSSVEIKSGRSAELALFFKRDVNDRGYFVGHRETYRNGKKPDERDFDFTTTFRMFRVMLQDQNERRYWMQCAVVNKAGRNLELLTPLKTWWWRWQCIRRAFRRYPKGQTDKTFRWRIGRLWAAIGPDDWYERQLS